MTQTATTNRTFKMGVRVLDFPLPDGSLDQNIEIMRQNYPQFRWTTIAETDAVPQSDGSLQYELVLPPPKVNG